MLKVIKFLSLVLAACLLSSCLGGTIAQQVAQSIATHLADSAVADHMAKQDKKEFDEARLNDTMAFASAGFKTVDTSTLPEESKPAEEEHHVAQANTLVNVELFNLLIGDEKNSVYEKARKQGALNLPHQREWPRWNVATGMINKEKKMITFLIPPEFGKLPSGAHAIVEVAAPGDLNIARYKAN